MPWRPCPARPLTFPFAGAAAAPHPQEKANPGNRRFLRTKKSPPERERTCTLLAQKGPPSECYSQPTGEPALRPARVRAVQGELEQREDAGSIPLLLISSTFDPQVAPLRHL